MRIRPNSATAYVLAKISTSLDTVSKAENAIYLKSKVKLFKRPLS